MSQLRIIDLQRRLREVGRIRTGDTVASQGGRGRPRKLERFRLTSSDRRVIDTAAALWSGEVTPWAAPAGPQWQTYLGVDEIPVVIPPGDMSFSQSFEQWSGGGCQVRCDGQWDHLADKACHCNPDPALRACAITTRLSVMVPDLPGIGVWRLETHSYFAAVELGGLVDLCSAAAQAGQMLPARLRLEQRSTKRITPAGKAQTNRFAVPVLDLDVHPLALGLGAGMVAGAIGPGAAAALPQGAAAAPQAAPPPPMLTPIPAPERALVPTVADQVAVIDEDPRPSTARRRQATLPSTGLRPRPAAEADVDPESDAVVASVVERRSGDTGFPCSVCGESYRDGRTIRRGRPAQGESEYVHTEHDPPAPDDDGQAATPAEQEAHASAREATAGTEENRRLHDNVPTPRQIGTLSYGVFRSDYAAAPRGAKTKAVERLRHALVYAVTGAAKVKAADCSPDELVKVWARLHDITEGRLAYATDDEGVTWTSSTGKRLHIRWEQLDAPATPEPEHDPQDDHAPGDGYAMTGPPE